MWRALPADFPPAWTMYYWADKWQADGSAERMHDDLRGRIRRAASRFPVSAFSRIVALAGIRDRS